MIEPLGFLLGMKRVSEVSVEVRFALKIISKNVGFCELDLYDLGYSDVGNDLH